jgi:hypothetical protein
MALDYSYYGTISDADTYFGYRLHEYVWNQSSATMKRNALIAATRLIDMLNYKGYKKAVNDLPDSANDATVAAAYLSQPLEFPRGSMVGVSDSTVPNDVIRACYEIAYSLLSGKDPEQELENIQVASQAYDRVRTAYDRGQLPLENVINMIPSVIAYNLLLPYLKDSNTIGLARIS